MSAEKEMNMVEILSEELGEKELKIMALEKQLEKSKKKSDKFEEAVCCLLKESVGIEICRYHQDTCHNKDNGWWDYGEDCFREYTDTNFGFISGKMFKNSGWLGEDFMEELNEDYGGEFKFVFSINDGSSVMCIKDVSRPPVPEDY
jgi:hypothetical protein